MQKQSATDAALQNPVLATLTLTENGKDRLKPALGADCVERDNFPVIVLASTDSKHDVVMIPDGVCNKPVKFTVDDDDGRS